MALSNIFKEPRREITESMVGFVPLILFILADYRAAVWFEAATGGSPKGVPWQAGMALGLLIFLVIVLLGGIALFATHALGESICGALAKRGIELRPKQRYK